MVGAAAVIGAVVDIDLLRDVLSDLSETDVLDAIDALLPRRVFRETGMPDTSSSCMTCSASCPTPTSQPRVGGACTGEWASCSSSAASRGGP